MSEKETDKINDLDFSSQQKKMIHRILEAIALEEEAIAKLVSMEADYIQAFIGTKDHFPTAPSMKQTIEFQQYIAQIVEKLTEKQKLLVRMMELSRDFLDNEELETNEQAYN